MGLLDFLKKRVEKTAKKKPAPSYTYTIKSGDSLPKIAKEFYGDSTAWNIIYKANDDKITNPNFIYPGQQIIIPDFSND